jgi:hypothetical protein
MAEAMNGEHAGGFKAQLAMPDDRSESFLVR